MPDRLARATESSNPRQDNKNASSFVDCVKKNNISVKQMSDS
jgi:hypothetical protein